MLEMIFWFMFYGALFLLFIFILFHFVSPKWQNTADTVSKRYLATRETLPELTDKEIFMTVLDERYPSSTGVLKHLHNQKEYYKDILITEIENKESLLKNYNLPTLIYTCLAIEKNNILYNKKKSGGIEKLLADIEKYVQKEGCQQYI